MPGFDLMIDAAAMGPPQSGGAALNPLAVVIAGDSITSSAPDQTGSTAAFYSYQWKAATPSRTVNIRAQASRTVGGPFWPGPPPEGADSGSPTGNTLLANSAEILDVYRPALLSVMIGANDLATFGVANYIERLIAWAAPLRAAGIKIAYSPPTPYRNSAPLHPNYAAYTARRSALLAQVRDPAVWGQWADYYVPMGEHPDFNEAALIPTLYADNVHPSAFDSAPAGSGGQTRLYAVFEKAMGSLCGCLACG
jgi:lysophospholipase L1-like esterase